MKEVALILTVLLAVGANLPPETLAQLGINRWLLVGLLGLMGGIGLLFHRQIALIILGVMMVVGVNLPEGLAMGMGLDRDVLAAALVALILVPIAAKILQ